MEIAVLLKLQNGSDVRGVALEGVPGEQVNLTPTATGVIVGGFVRFLSEKTGKPAEKLKITLGHDTRISAEKLKRAALGALNARKVEAVDCGLASTPAMFMSTVFDEIKADGAIMLTASHLPFNRNGLKFFTVDGGLEKSDIRTVLTYAAEEQEPTAEEYENTGKSGEGRFDLMTVYAAHLRRIICQKLGADEKDRPLNGMRVAVDAGGGGGGFFAEKILSPLGADTTGSQFLEPDGMFSHHIPNPENKEAMTALKETVAKNSADLGLIFDTDVDRMGAVLPDGTELGRNALIAMMAAILAPDYPGSTIVTDSVTSDELTEFLTGELKLKHHRFKRGYKNVINECKRLNESGTVSPLAIETSGHGAVSENYYLDDGAYLAVLLLVAAAKAHQAGKNIGDLIKNLRYPAESREYRLAINGQDNPQTYGDKVIQAVTERAAQAGIQIAVPNYEGVRLIFPNGWALLRMSLHDPNMPLNVESRAANGCQTIANQIAGFLTDFPALDTKALQ